MTIKQIEHRLAELEREVAALRADNTPEKQWWKSWVGIATDDPLMKEAFQLALKYRQENRKDARKLSTKQDSKRRKK